jgi:hypothetical protein
LEANNHLYKKYTNKQNVFHRQLCKNLQAILSFEICFFRKILLQEHCYE